MWRVLKRNNNYCVNERGEVLSLRKNKILSPKRNWDGYLRIQLWEHNHCKYISIHRLVAEEFIPNPTNKPFVNHIDGDKTNNSVDNLEWCTQQENIRHAWDTGLSRPHFNSKLSKAVWQCDSSGNKIKMFPSTMEVERQLGIKHSNISYACKHNSTCHGYRWKYDENL